ncbi:MAG: fibrillarin-like rRNA/tRNA 2'-O-methyltransferase [Thermoplasmata archaeon]
MEVPGWPKLEREGQALLTPNARPGHSLHGEARRTIRGTEYREWDPWRSKLAAYILRGGAPLGVGSVRKILYLGGAHGTTAAHLSELRPGRPLFAIEKSPSSFAALLALARDREDILPILADAHLPERYRAEVGSVDLLYQDVAQRDQATIFEENARACLASGGRGVLMLKVRSVTQARSPGMVLRETRDALLAAGLTIRMSVDLAPFSRDHIALAVGW